eukprot:5596309-Pyramimonas_sp.AAC.1
MHTHTIAFAESPTESPICVDIRWRSIHPNVDGRSQPVETTRYALPQSQPNSQHASIDIDYSSRERLDLSLFYNLAPYFQTASCAPQSSSNPCTSRRGMRRGS